MVCYLILTLLAKISSEKEVKNFDKTLKILLDWGEEYGMKWGAHKTQRMGLSGRNGRDLPQMFFDNKEILATETIEILGVLLNKQCISYAQIYKIKNKIAAIRTLVAKNYRIRTQKILERIYTTYIVPHINYCSQQWNTNMEVHLRGIETEIKRFWKLSQERMRPSNILGLREQLIYNDLKQLHKIRHGKSTIDFHDFFTITEHQLKTNQEIETKKSTRAFAQYSFGHRVQNTGMPSHWKQET